MSSTRRLAFLATVLAGVVALSACSGSAPGSAQPSTESGATTAPAATSEASAEASPVALKTIKIGVLAPLTGAVAADGQEMVDAITLAADKVNAAGGACGYTFEPLVVDVQYERPDAVKSGAERLFADPDVHVVMTGFASGTNFEIDLMADANMPYLVATNSTQTRDIIAKDPSRYGTVWSLSPSYDGYQTELPKVIQEQIDAGKFTPRNKKVYLITADNPYSTTISDGLKKNFEAIGWTAVGGDIVATGAVNDWRTILQKVRQEDPDLVVNTDYTYQNEALFMNQFMENPVNALVFLQYAPQVPEFVDLTKGTSDGVRYNVLITPVPGSERAAQLKQDFSDKFGREGGIYSIAMQEAVDLYKDAVCAVLDPTDHTAIGDWIGKVKKDSALGTIEFDQTTHLALQDAEHMPILFYQLGPNGERVLIWPENYADGEFRTPPYFK